MKSETSPNVIIRAFVTYFNVNSNIAVEEQISASNIVNLHWASTMNYGYIIKLDVNDKNMTGLQNTGNYNIIEQYLKYGKTYPFYIKLKIDYERFINPQYNTTDWFWGVIDSISPYYGEIAMFAITAIDPITWFLKRNILDGKAFNGTFSEFYEWLINESNKKQYGMLLPNKKIKINMKDTNYKYNSTWYTFRKTPLDIIRDNLELGRLFSPSKTPYILTVDNGNNPDNFNIYIKDQEQLYQEAHKLYYEYKGINDFVIGGYPTKGVDIASYQPYAAIYDAWQGYSQKRLTCNYISSTTGDVIDDPKITNVDSVNILNVKSKISETFNKPAINQGSYILPQPEIHDGSWGKYKLYIDSSAKKLYGDMHQSTMKAEFTLQGTPYISNSRYLGSYIISINFSITNDKKFFLNGLWIIYGFEHSVVKYKMNTKLLLYRLDNNFKTRYKIEVS